MNQDHIDYPELIDITAEELAFDHVAGDEPSFPEVEHDCHASPEDGCTFCFEHENTL